MKFIFKKNTLFYFHSNFYIVVILTYQLIKMDYCFASWFNYNSFLIGERAAGMGGAYTAISDDPSGIYYNPAGVAFSRGAEMNVSTTGYYLEEVQIHSVAGIPNYQYEGKNTDIINGFFGLTNKVELWGREFYIGLGVYIPDNTNVYTKININSPSYYQNILVQKLSIIERETGKEANYQLLLAHKILEYLGLGLSLGVFSIQEDTLVSTDLLLGPEQVYSSYINSSSFTTSSLAINGININLGSLIKISPNIAFGLAINFKVPIYQYYSKQNKSSLLFVDSNGVPRKDVTFEEYTDRVETTESKSFIKLLPTKFSLGLSYFLASNWLISSDFYYYTGMHSEIDEFSSKAIYNYAVGSEFSLFENLKIRVGHFTNNWAEEDSNETSFKNFDLLGFSTGISYTSENKKSLSLTGVYQFSQSAKIKNISNYSDVYWTSLSIILGFSSGM